MIEAIPGGPFARVVDVGGNVGGFAEEAWRRWPEAFVLSIEPIPELARLSATRSAGRWRVLCCAISDESGSATLYVCENQHSASTMAEPGEARRQSFGQADSYVPVNVPTRTLDSLASELDSLVDEWAGGGALLLKVDVEGWEGHVLAGAGELLREAQTVVVECQQSADVFVDAPTPAEISRRLRGFGLHFAGVAGALCSPAGELLQFDGVWTRDPDSD